jgi:hypothetical protein
LEAAAVYTHATWLLSLLSLLAQLLLLLFQQLLFQLRRQAAAAATTPHFHFSTNSYRSW